MVDVYQLLMHGLETELVLQLEVLKGNIAAKFGDFIAQLL